MLPYCLEPITRIYNTRTKTEIQTEEVFNFGHKALFGNENDYFFFILERKNCKVINKNVLTLFLDNNKQIKNDILDVLGVISDNFGSYQKTSMELFIDEEEKGYGEIFVNIILRDDNNLNMEKFIRTNNWFIENIYKNRQLLNINLEFE